MSGRAIGIVFLFLLAGLAQVGGRFLGSGGDSLPGDLGDPRFVHFILEHGFRSLRGEPLHAEFWSPPFFFPARDTAALSEVLWGTLPLYAGSRVLGFSEPGAYAFWLYAQYALNFFAMFGLLSRGFRFRVWPAAGGAFLFAFALMRAGRGGHSQLVGQFWTPLCFWALLAVGRAHAAGRRAWGAWASAFSCWVLQLYSSFYLGWFLSFELLLLGVIAKTWIWRSGGLARLQNEALRFLRLQGAAIALGAAGAGLALVPYFQGYLRGRIQGGFLWEQIAGMAPRLSTWFYPGEHHLLYGGLVRALGWNRALPVQHEHVSGVGFITLAIVGLGLVRIWRSRQRIDRISEVWGVLMGVSLFCLSLNFLPDIFGDSASLWPVIRKLIPGAAPIRAIARITLAVLPVMSLALAVVWRDWEDSRSRYRLGGMVFLSASLIFEQAAWIPHFSRAESEARIDQIVRKVEPRCQTFYSLPGSGVDTVDDQLDAVWAGMRLRKPAINGYSGYPPEGYPLWATYQRTERDEVARRVEYWLRLARSGSSARFFPFAEPICVVDPR